VKHAGAARAAACLLLAGFFRAGNAQLPAGDQTMPGPVLREVMPQPRAYLATRRTLPIAVDGRLDEAAWSRTAWSADFTDIEGLIRPRPRLRTRVKMLWDDSAWYVAAELEEPDLWATIRERDAVIFHDNDFELFVDPSGSTHRYFELELNALATVWDLFLPKPYRDGGQAVNGWDIAGLRVAVALQGTLDNPRDRDHGWTAELAIPWSAFADSTPVSVPVPPHAGDSWRVNFSRVEWDREVAGGKYRPRRESMTGKLLPEHNWVWSPQGAVNMHLPEMWGVVQFGGERLRRDSANDTARWTLRRVYYAERDFRRLRGSYTNDVRALGLRRLPPEVGLQLSADGWEASLPRTTQHAAWHIRADGLIWHD
jgi:hypothetical protein